MIESHYTIAHPEVVFERFDGDLVVLDLRSGRYFGFNPVGAVTWLSLMEGVFARDIVSAGLDEKQLLTFLEALLREGVAVQSEGSRKSIPAEYLGLISTGEEGPSFEAYDDLSDLMMADPIHDVDAERGWPHLPKGD